MRAGCRILGRRSRSGQGARLCLGAHPAGEGGRRCSVSRELSLGSAGLQPFNAQGASSGHESAVLSSFITVEVIRWSCGDAPLPRALEELFIYFFVVLKMRFCSGH